MPSDDVDDSRTVEVVYVLSESTNVVKDTLVVSSTSILNEIHISSESISDVIDALVGSSTPITNDIYVHKKDTSDPEHVLVESSIPVQVTKYSLATPMIVDGIEYEMLLTSLHLEGHQSPLVQIVKFTYTSHTKRKCQFIF